MRCVKTNEVFESITKAAKWTGVTFFTLSVAVAKNYRTEGCYHWEYADKAQNHPPPVIIAGINGAKISAAIAAAR